jgi:hypothetical protein
VDHHTGQDMAITVERVDEDHWAIHCTDGEWEDIKKIMAYALETYDSHATLDHILPRRILNGKKEESSYKYFVEICKEIESMNSSPEKIYVHGYFAINTTISFLAYPERGKLSGISQDRFEYLDQELSKPKILEKPNTQSVLIGN